MNQCGEPVMCPFVGPSLYLSFSSVFWIGLYPLVGWKIGADVVYLAEGNAAGTGAAIKWAQDLGEEETNMDLQAYTHFLT